MSTTPDAASCAITVTVPSPFRKFNAFRSSISPPRRFGQQCPDAGGKRAVRGDGAAAECSITTVPVGEGAPRLLHDRKKRRGIPGREDGIAHHLGASRGHEVIAESVAQRTG